MSKKPSNVDEFLSGVSQDKRVALEKLRQTIKASAPKAEECIAYGIPGYRLDVYLVGFGAGRNHCAFYPGGITQEFADELKDFETSKGTIRFQPKKPPPVALVQKIVKARIAQNSERQKQRKKS